MCVLGIVGAGVTIPCDRFIVQLDGHAATMGSLPESVIEPEPTDGIVVTYGLSPDGNWIESDDDRDLDGPFGDLSVEYGHALLPRFPDAYIPAIAPAGVDAANVVAEAETADAADVAFLAAGIGSHEPHVTLETLVEHAKTDPLEVYAGMIATFTGRMHAKEFEDGDPTLSLGFEKYDGVAESKMDAISEELEARDGIPRVFMHHQVGVVEDDTDIVFVVVLTGHCQEAFRTVEDSIDRPKGEVSIFKKKTITDGEF